MGHTSWLSYTPIKKHPVFKTFFFKKLDLVSGQNIFKSKFITTVYAVNSKLSPDVLTGGGCWLRTFQTSSCKSLHAQTSHAHTHTAPKLADKHGKAAV